MARRRHRSIHFPVNPMSNRQTFEWKPDGDTLVADVEHLTITLSSAESGWLGSVHAGEARLSLTRGATQEAVRRTVEKRVGRLLSIEHGECEDCGGVTYPFRGGPMRCLTRGCERYKKG